MTLSGYNPELSNRPFAEKRARLRESGLAMNHEIAAAERWGKTEILARADRLAERAMRLWPGPGRRSAKQPNVTLLSALRQVLAAVPAGTWTSYADLAELTGWHTVPLASAIASNSLPHTWRVLRSDGSIPPGFRWCDAQRDDDPRDVLHAEGVEFGPDGRANPAQRLSADELADLLGLAPDEPVIEEGPVSAGEESFWSLLAAHQPPEVVHAVNELMACWRRLGGRFRCGAAEETSCTFVLSGMDGRYDVWPWTLYPRYGAAEVAFQHLKSRPPFDSTSVRDQLRRELLRIPGVDVPEGKLDLRPSFPLAALASDAGLTAACRALEWFALRALSSDEALVHD